MTNETTIDEDRGPWIHTWSGGRFYYLSPRAEEVVIEDIAHALSMQCRFNGHTSEHYSVAEHSVLVSDMVFSKTGDATLGLTALLHDAAEAYIGDVVSPLKKLLTEFKSIESVVERCIAERYDLVFPWDEEIHIADKAVLAMEFRFVAPFAEDKLARSPLSPKASERRFLERFAHLTNLRGENENKG